MHLTWRMYHVHLKIIYIPLSGGVFYKCYSGKLLNVVIQIIFIFTDFLSSCFINH